MKRRQTSVVNAQRAAQATPVDAFGGAAGPVMARADGDALYAPGLRHWALRVARQLVLSAVPLGSDGEDELLDLGDALMAQRQQQQHAEVVHRWRIATRLENGNPAPSGERSSLAWFCPDGDHRYYWRKVYAAAYGHLQSNEHHVLLELDRAAASANVDLNQHVGWFRQIRSGGRGTSLPEVETLDAGPNLDMWQDFAPCVGTGQGALPLPLFAQPVFLAAIARQTLIALEALAQVKLVHGDLKPGNLCLALPPGLDSSAPLISGTWDLRHLPLRLIDFEFSFVQDFTRRVIPLRPPRLVDGQALEYNANFSPFVHACHRAAMAMAQPRDVRSCLEAIDWGADLWALGDMLEQYALQAKAFIAAYGAAFSEAFGQGSLEHQFADQSLAGLLQQCGQLLQFAQRLKDQERSVAEAGQLTLAERTDHPHQRLWTELQTLFPNLGERAASSVRTLNFFNPAIPPGREDLALAAAAPAPAPAPAPGPTAAPTARPAAGATGAAFEPKAASPPAGRSQWPLAWRGFDQRVRETARRFGRGVADTGVQAARALGRYRAPALTLAALVALPALAWSWRAEAANFALSISQRQAAMELKTYHVNGASTSRWLARTWLAMADTFQPGQADAITLATLAESPQFDSAMPL